MTLDEFWNGSPQLVRYYKEAHRLKVEEVNQKSWLQGLYIKSALDSSLSQIFKKKGSKGVQYIEKPLKLFPDTEEQKKKIAEAERKKAVDFFNRLIKEQQARKQSQKRGEINADNSRRT